MSYELAHIKQIMQDSYKDKETLQDRVVNAVFPEATRIMMTPEQVKGTRDIAGDVISALYEEDLFPCPKCRIMYSQQFETDQCCAKTDKCPMCPND